MLLVSVSQTSQQVKREAPPRRRKFVLVVSSITCESLDNCDPPNSKTRESTPHLTTTLSSLLSHKIGIAAVTHGTVREERREAKIMCLLLIEAGAQRKRHVRVCVIVDNTVVCCGNMEVIGCRWL